MNIPCSSCSLRQGRCCRPTRRSPARCGPPGWVSAGCSTGQLWGRSTPPTLHLDGRNLCEKGRKHLKAMSGHRCVSVEMLVLWITVVQLLGSVLESAYREGTEGWLIIESTQCVVLI